MERREYHFHSCTSTAGKPFEDGPRCPLFLKTSEFLNGKGWKQVYYNSFKTGKGDLCNSRFKRTWTPENSQSDITGMMELVIEGTKTTCTLKAILNTYRPKNILTSIHHGSEKEIIGELDAFFNEDTI